MKSRPAFAETLSNPITWGALIICAWSIMWVIGGCSVVIDGQRYFFLADDPTISLRYGRNLANGLGLVWNAGERVEGYSNFLWALYMAGLHLLPIASPYMGLAVMLTNVAIALLGLFLAYRLALKLMPTTSLAACVALAYALNGDVFEWMIRGFETSLMATLLLAAFLGLIGDSEKGRPRLTTYLLIGSLTLVRTDGLILAAPLLLLGILTTPERLRALAWAAVAMSMPIAHLMFRWIYYGDYLPNTAYLKLFGFAGRQVAGLKWTLKFYATYPIAMALLLVALVRMRDWPLRGAALLCLMFTAYTVYIGGDSFSGFRFLAPIVPLLLIVAFATAWRVTGPETEARVERMANRLFSQPWLESAVLLIGLIAFVMGALMWPERGQERILRQSAISLVGALGLGAAVLAGAHMANRRMRSPVASSAKALGLAYPARFALLAALLANMPLVLWSHRHPAPWGPTYPDNVRLGVFIKANTPANASIGDTWAGITAYFSERRGIDFLGKCEPHVARMPAASEGTVPGHNKFDFEYSIGKLKPDYVAATFKLPVTQADMAEDARGDYAFIGRLYFSEAFRQHCLPYPVPASLGFRRTLFACRWSNNGGTDLVGNAAPSMRNP